MSFRGLRNVILSLVGRLLGGLRDLRLLVLGLDLPGRPLVLGPGPCLPGNLVY